MRPFTSHFRRRFTYRPPQGPQATVQRGEAHLPAYVAKEAK